MELSKDFTIIYNRDEKIRWILAQHVSTNHLYDNYIPYEFHLRMVLKVAQDYKHLVDPMTFAAHYNRAEVDLDVAKVFTDNCLVRAAFGHDLIEDTRVSFNDVSEKLGPVTAEIIYAVTNEKGKNRKERANDKYYEGIRNTTGAVFIKLCDRIANVQYSKMTGSRMFEMYKKENPEFTKALGLRGDGVDYPGHEYYKMYQHLNSLFKK